MPAQSEAISLLTASKEGPSCASLRCDAILPAWASVKPTMISTFSYSVPNRTRKGNNKNKISLKVSECTADSSSNAKQMGGEEAMDLSIYSHRIASHRVEMQMHLRGELASFSTVLYACRCIKYPLRHVSKLPVSGCFPSSLYFNKRLRRQLSKVFFIP